MVMARGLRDGVLAGGLAVAVAAGCYNYRPLTAPVPAAGTPVSLVLNDQGRAAVAESIGSGAARVEGTVVRATDNVYVVSVSGVQGINGRVTRWSGETVGLRRDYVAAPYERRLSKQKTILLISSVAAAFGAFFVTRDLLGFGGPQVDPGAGGPPNDQ
jgi:hypothetical protein